MKWDAWPTTRQDFDLYVGSDACAASIGAGSRERPGERAAPPVELVPIELRRPGVHRTARLADQVYEVIVDRWAGTATPRLDFFFDGDVIAIEHATGGSVSEPATSPAAMAVGAHCEATGAIQSYSSRGPTIDGRVKPDISGPDGTSSSVYGAQSGCTDGFTGHLGLRAARGRRGRAACSRPTPASTSPSSSSSSRTGPWTPGPPGDDNAYGSGRLRLGAAGQRHRPDAAGLHAA